MCCACFEKHCSVVTLMTKRFSQQQKYHDRMYSDTSSLNAHSRLICWDYSPSVAHLAPSLSLLPFSLVYERLCFSLLTCVIPCVRFGLVWFRATFICHSVCVYVKLAFKSEVKRSTLTVLHPITHSHIYCTGQTVPVCFFPHISYHSGCKPMIFFFLFFLFE